MYIRHVQSRFEHFESRIKTFLWIKGINRENRQHYTEVMLNFSEPINDLKMCLITFWTCWGSALTFAIRNLGHEATVLLLEVSHSVRISTAIALSCNVGFYCFVSSSKEEQGITETIMALEHIRQRERNDQGSENWEVCGGWN